MHPISLSSPISTAGKPLETRVISPNPGEKVFESKLTSSDPSSDSLINTLDHRSSRIIKNVGNLPHDVFKKTPQGEEFLDNLEKWFASLRSQAGNNVESAESMTQLRSKGDRNASTKNRTILFS